MSADVIPITRPAATAAYRPNTWGGAWISAALDGRPRFNWLEAERMRRDPQVQFGLRILRAPLYGVTVQAAADSDRVGRWVGREFDAVYRRILPRACRAFEYGVAVGEVTYARRRGKVHFADFREVHPRDARPVTYAAGRRAGQFVGLEVRNVGTDGVVYLDAPHSFWFKGETEYDDWYGRPRMAGAFQPWLDKGGRHGAADMCRLFYKKMAFAGPKMRYPLGFSDVGDVGSPLVMNNGDVAREIVEKFETGGVVAMPNVRDDKGNSLWEWEDPKSFPDAAGLLDYKKALDRDITIGLGIPPELIDAATVGSGYSGRAIPAQVFFSSMDEFAALLVEAIDRQILRPLVRLNFGRVGYELKPDSLAKMVAQGPPQPGAGAGLPTAAPPPPAPGRGSVPVPFTGPRGGHWMTDPRTGRKWHARLSHDRAKALWESVEGPVFAEAGG